MQYHMGFKVAGKETVIKVLKKSKFLPLTSKEIRPQGWLRRQLEIQAKGLSGNLDRVWPDVRDSAWLGGSRDGWERMPYWLDGFIPLAYLLDDPELKAKADRYVETILSRQEPDGWICPCKPEERGAYDVWTVFLIAKVLALYADCAGDAEGRVQKALSGVLKSLDAHLDYNSLFNWAASRWFECLIPIFWLYERTGEEWLLDLAQKLEVEGVDYELLFQDFREKEPHRRWTYLTHVVNLAMCLKQGALKYRLHGGDPEAFAGLALEKLFQYHGMAASHFTGDECLSGDSPIQGTELCGVVEAMYSYETLLSISGGARWGDLLEKLAFNALPATLSEDMWTHQYLQLTNQPQCSILPKDHVIFRTNGEEAHLFGLEPNFGCCTANFSQGWPKFALSTFQRSAGGVVSAVLAPSSVNLEIEGVQVACRLDTEYPFRGSLCYTVESGSPVEFELLIRIPGFVKTAVVDGKPAAAGQFYSVKRRWQGTEKVRVELSFSCELTSRPRGLACLWRGPLLYSLPIKERWEKREYCKDGVERKFPYCDYEIFPESPWNYGFAGSCFEAEEHPMGKTPFSGKEPPVTVACSLAQVDWPFQWGVCAVEPGKTSISVSETRKLVPYGCTTLRMTELPVLF